MARFEVEFSRTNVTVGQFLAYVRAQLKKRGLGEFIGSLGYENFIGGNGIDAKVNHKEQNDTAYTELGIEYEEVRDLPYNKKSYQRTVNGVASNEIIEFEFDNEKSGRGYYYLVDGVDEVESVESTTEAETETETDVESESVNNGENNSCGERATANKANRDADNLKTAREGYKMKMENMIKAVVEAIHHYGEDGNYDPFYGIRGDDRELKVGDKFGNSHQLYQDPIDGAEYIGAGLYDAGELDGTCVWSIGLYSEFYEPDKKNIRWAIEQAKLFGEHIYLVRSKCPSKSGEELGEIIVENAYVALKIS